MLEVAIYMNKKIITVLFLLIILVSITLVYNYYDKTSNDEKQYDSLTETISENDISDEIENSFIEEDDEIEIGDMI